jgi:hypothetical protein
VTPSRSAKHLADANPIAAINPARLQTEFCRNRMSLKDWMPGWWWLALAGRRIRRDVGLSQKGDVFVDALHFGGNNNDACERPGTGDFGRGATRAGGVPGQMPRR